MTTSSGQSSTSSTQPYIMSGPSVAAAQMASQAQVNAAQIAASAATQNTQSAISALMQQYGTSLTYANPTINTGNQAEAQLNYMLGLPAVNPGAAPTTPGLNDYMSKVTSSDIYNYMNQNMYTDVSIGKNPHPEVTANGTAPQPVNTATYYVDPITGARVGELAPGDLIAGSWGYGGSVNPQDFIGNASNVGPGGGNTPGAGGQSGSLYKDTQQYLAQQMVDQAMPGYNQQMAQWQQQKDTYDKYNTLGTASPGDISNIVTNMPGFQFAQQQGINSIQNAASASGQLNSGNLLEGLNQFGQGLSQQYYQQYLGNLSGLAGLGQQASSQAISGANALGSNIANSYINLGNAQANSALAQGQAIASGYLSPVQNQSVSMTPYTTTSTTNSSQSGSAMGGISQGIGILSSLGGLF